MKNIVQNVIGDQQDEGEDNANMSTKYFCAKDNYQEYLTGVLMRKTGKTIMRRMYLQLRVLI